MVVFTRVFFHKSFCGGWVLFAVSFVSWFAFSLEGYCPVCHNCCRLTKGQRSLPTMFASRSGGISMTNTTCGWLSTSILSCSGAVLLLAHWLFQQLHLELSRGCLTPGPLACPTPPSSAVQRLSHPWPSVRPNTSILSCPRAISPLAQWLTQHLHLELSKGCLTPGPVAGPTSPSWAVQGLSHSPLAQWLAQHLYLELSKGCLTPGPVSDPTPPSWAVQGCFNPCPVSGPTPPSWAVQGLSHPCPSGWPNTFILSCPRVISPLAWWLAQHLHLELSKGASVPLSDSVKNLCVTIDCHLTVSPFWYAQLSLNSITLVPSIIFCPQMPQKLMSLPLFFHILLLQLSSF